MLYINIYVFKKKVFSITWKSRKSKSNKINYLLIYALST